MRRRTFARSLAGTALAASGAATAQAPALPAVGFLRSTPGAAFAGLLTALRTGLAESGLVEGRDVTIEQRYADNDPDRLPALVAELVARKVAVIVGNTLAVMAAKGAVGTTPIVFVVGDDPVRSGLVTNLSRPEGNITGITFFGGGWGDAKRMELLHELLPAAKRVAVMLDPGYPGAEASLPEVMAVARAAGKDLVVLRPASAAAIAAAFAQAAESHAEALLVSGSPVFTSERQQIVALAARHALPAIYDVRQFVSAGGLISYAASITAAYREAGRYAARIIQGATPSDLPVMQPTVLEMVVNLKTARALGIDVPLSILVRADEVIE